MFVGNALQDRHSLRQSHGWLLPHGSHWQHKAQMDEEGQPQSETVAHAITSPLIQILLPPQLPVDNNISLFNYIIDISLIFSIYQALVIIPFLKYINF